MNEYEHFLCLHWVRSAQKDTQVGAALNEPLVNKTATEKFSWTANQSDRKRKSDSAAQSPFEGTLYLLVAMAMQFRI